MPEEIIIACPKCDWEPKQSDRWICLPGCGHLWNTFDTAAKCPGCGIQWEYTQCLCCKGVSRHTHWYRSLGSNLQEELDLVDKEMQETVEA